MERLVMFLQRLTKYFKMLTVFNRQCNDLDHANMILVSKTLTLLGVNKYKHLFPFKLNNSLNNIQSQ